MLTTTDFCLLRADECKRDAGEASLANVRDRFLRSEATWRGMAERAGRADLRREANGTAAAAPEGLDHPPSAVQAD